MGFYSDIFMKDSDIVVPFTLTPDTPRFIPEKSNHIPNLPFEYGAHFLTRDKCLESGLDWKPPEFRQDETDGTLYEFMEAVYFWQFGSFINTLFDKQYTLDQMPDIFELFGYTIVMILEDNFGDLFEITDFTASKLFNFREWERNPNSFTTLANTLTKTGFEELLEAYEQGVPVDDIII